MKLGYKIFRLLIVTLLMLAVVIPVGIYVTVSLPPVQRHLKGIAEIELSRLLDTEVSIGDLSITPFNHASLDDVVVKDLNGDTALYAKKIAAGIDMYNLLVRQKISISYTVIRGVDARLYRDSLGSQLNIQPIIDALKPKEKSKPPTLFEFNANTIILRQWDISYNVLSEPPADGRFDRNHIKIQNFRADITLPLIKNDDFTADIRRLAFDEKNGFILTNLSGLFHVAKTGIATSDVRIDLPATKISLGDINISYNDWLDLRQSIYDNPLSFKVERGSYFTPSDLSSFMPALSRFESTLDLDIDIHGTAERLDIYRCRIGAPDQAAYIDIHGQMQSISDRERIFIDLPQLLFSADGADVAVIADAFTSISSQAKAYLANMGLIKIDGMASGGFEQATASFEASTAQGKATIDAEYTKHRFTQNLSIALNTPGIKLGEILRRNDIGTIAADITAEASFSPGHRKANVDGTVSSLIFRNHNYEDIKLTASLTDNEAQCQVSVDDPAADIIIEGSARWDKKMLAVDGYAAVAGLDLSQLNLWDKYPGYILSGELTADIQGQSIETSVGTISLKNISFKNAANSGVGIDDITLTAQNDITPRHMELKSDFIDGEISGQYHFASLWPQLKEILYHSFPVLVSEENLADNRRKKATASIGNDFSFNLTLKENSEISRLAKLPFTVLAPIEIQGTVNHDTQRMEINIDAPYLQQKDKLIENTAFYANIDGTDNHCALYATTQIPTKDGSMPIVLECHGLNNDLDTRLKWDIDRKRAYRGDISLSAHLDTDADGRLIAGVDVNESRMVFNDSVWTIHPAKIFYRTKDIEVIDVNVSRSNQHVKINGYATADENENLSVELLNVNLDYIFESLGLDNVMIGGDATGTITATGLFSPAPHLYTDDLSVAGISYNKAVLGSAKIKSHWDNDRRAVNIDADILQPNEARSRIYGDIFALNDSLDIRFDANQVDVRFMAPFMAAFASDISGYASGKARLWGNFKYIDFEGAVLAQDLKLKIDFTNTVYTATDSVRFTPGNISLKNVLLFDAYGHTATINGVIKHKFFKQPSFNFQVTEAEDLLVYDVNQRMNPDWYGHIFASGTAWIKGEPGIIDIGANMTTAPKSTFTFVLSDRQEASEYNFVTFRDKALLAQQDSIAALDDTPEAVKKFRSNIRKQEEASASVYNLNFDISVNPFMKIILVMDPEGGDQVTAYGNGNIHMGYDSSDEDLVMRGIYTVERGTYNFTLQDIIIKDFTINSGSSISFQGSPYNAVLDMTAVYTTNANLSDLDESFLQDKELNRTNVPVQALLMVNGDMRNPDLSFDLGFPTLTNDTYRKVRSIVSTEEMMNRQIIYLLALNRFYTPDYMSSTTKGNEFVSVASSTISSQLSNILGQLSDNWTIAPNVRSDRGDFSDVEVDLALSSQLLNNRLLFNGNLGYRDKSLNTNQFVGDFDIEYLLNRSGNVRLKAYNRYNDQNFYIKTATTTQGVGIMFRRDFDRMFGFLRRKKKAVAATPDTTATDSILNDAFLKLPVKE